MTTNSSIEHGSILAAQQSFLPVRTRGWLGGFGNMFNKEMGDWFATRRWIVQGLLWLTIINGLMAFIMFIVPTFDSSEQLDSTARLAQGVGLFFGFTVIFGSIGMIILAQDEVIQEKQTGTAAWILTKPVSRSSFILSKLLSNFIGGSIFIAVLPGIVAYAEIFFDTGKLLPVDAFLIGVGVVVLTLVFYLTMVIMLGTLFEQRGPVLGIAVTVLLGGMIASQFLPQASYILPVNMHTIASAFAAGDTVPQVALIQLTATAVWSLLFVVVALLRFRSLEL